jgi:hypothetical protein
MIKLPGVAAEHREAGLGTTPDYLPVSRSNPKASGQLALQERRRRKAEDRALLGDFLCHTTAIPMVKIVTRRKGHCRDH